MYKHTYGGPWEDWTPDDVRSLKALADGQRRASGPFDIMVGGNGRDDDLERRRALARSLAEAGATWWLEYISPDTGYVDTVRDHIAGRPLRID